MIMKVLFSALFAVAVVIPPALADKREDAFAGVERWSEAFVIEAMLEVIGTHGPGHRKREISDALRVAGVKRGLTFEYCLLAAGVSQNRTPSD